MAARDPNMGATAGRTMRLLLAIQAALLVFLAYRYAPVIDEPAHIAAGLSYWRLGTFEIYRVNPPLTRLIAAAPLAAAGVQSEWNGYVAGPAARPEWALGSGLLREHADNWPSLIFMARLALIPLVLAGGYVCYRWAAELYGRRAGLLALTLWCFCPNVLAWGAVVTPDAAAASTGVLAAYCFRHWLLGPNLSRTFFAGLTLGLAELTKTTWIVLFPLWPVLWLCVRAFPLSEKRRAAREAGHLAGVLLMALYVLNVGYGFEGSFQRLDSYTFVSESLAGEDSIDHQGTGGNRFAGRAIGALRAPLPQPYVSGIDLQKLDFEKKMTSFLFGEWKEGGWWYYYLVCAALKVPLGTWILAVIALYLTIRSALHRRTGDPVNVDSAEITAVSPQMCRARPTVCCWAGWRNELVLLAPAVAVLLLVSSQTGFSRYFRYVLPCLPFAFIWISKAAVSFAPPRSQLAWIVSGALAWSALSSLWVYPYSLSYFNELAGGPSGGHRYLLDANIDWGQDLWELKKWYDANPDARPLYTDLYTFTDNSCFGIEATNIEELAVGEMIHRSRGGARPPPGWYAISVHRLHEPRDRFRAYWQERQPVRTIGQSIRIYHVHRAKPRVAFIGE